MLTVEHNCNGALAGGYTERMDHGGIDGARCVTDGDHGGIDGGHSGIDGGHSGIDGAHSITDGGRSGIDGDHDGIDGDHDGIDGDHDGIDGDHDGIEGAPATNAPRDQEAGHSAGVDLHGLRQQALHKGVNPLLYWAVRAVLVPFFLVYFRLERIGREHLPRRGGLLLASNHRSFLDPFVIGTLVRRPVYYMAKRELFEKAWQARLLNSLGAFPVDRGAGDGEAIATAREILRRGDCVVVFPEGTRTRPGPLGEPHRGVGRLALETGAPVAPVAVIGTEDVRRGWIVRPRAVRLRVGMPLRFPTAERPSPQLAATVTRRIWACVSLQWEWLGGARGPRARTDGGENPVREAARAA